MAGGGLHADAPSSSLRAADPLAVLPLIEGIEDLSAASTGALVFTAQGRTEGTILVEKGRICWAATARMGHRLTDILRSRLDPEVGPRALEEIVRRCRDEGTPLGETLVASSLISSDSLREALRQHTSEAILFLAQRSGEPPTWLPHRKHRYDARFTFSPAELLASVGAVCLPDLAEQSRAEMDKLLRAVGKGGGGGGVAFTWVGVSATLFPICEIHGANFSVRETVDLGVWATRMLEMPLMLRAVPQLVTIVGAKGDAIVAWISEGIVYVVICQNPSSLAHVLSKRARAAPEVRSGS
jgi:hypothetical protein